MNYTGKPESKKHEKHKLSDVSLPPYTDQSDFEKQRFKSKFLQNVFFSGFLLHDE